MPLGPERWTNRVNAAICQRRPRRSLRAGDTLAVGAHAEDSAADGDGENNEASSSGAAYVFTRTGTKWEEQAYLKAWNPESNDNFGYAVSLWGDTLAVGAYGEDGAAGAVHVFTRTGTKWEEQQDYLKASNPSAGAYFGYAVSLWGDTVAVGAYKSPRTPGDPMFESGAVYVFTWTGTKWEQQDNLKASNASAGAHFGYAVSLWGDTLAVGANQESNGASNSGAVYVFTRSGTTWSEQVRLTAFNTGADDVFGSAIALWGDTLAVGAYQEDSSATGIGGDQSDDTAENSGAVYIFR